MRQKRKKRQLSKQTSEYPIPKIHRPSSLYFIDSIHHQSSIYYIRNCSNLTFVAVFVATTLLILSCFNWVTLSHNRQCGRTKAKIWQLTIGPIKCYVVSYYSSTISVTYFPCYYSLERVIGPSLPARSGEQVSLHFPKVLIFFFVKAFPFTSVCVGW